MVKCPFCQYNNEDGALFCEQCKSDLSSVESMAAPAAHHAGGHDEVPVASVVGGEHIPMAHAEHIPMAHAEHIPEAPIVQALPVEEEPSTIPIAGLAVAEPMPEVPQTIPIHQPEAAPPPMTPEPPAPVAHQAPPQAAPAPPPVQPAAPPSAPTPGLGPDAQPKLVVLRGQRPNVEYPVYEGQNWIGRSDEKPVDIDLEDQEPPDRIWSSRQHALISFEDGGLVIEDLNSSNGTFVNRTRIYPGQKTPLKINDVIQIGTVQMKVKV